MPLIIEVKTRWYRNEQGKEQCNIFSSNFPCVDMEINGIVSLENAGKDTGQDGQYRSCGDDGFENLAKF